MGTEPSGQEIQGSRYLEQRLEGQGTGSWWASPLGLTDPLYSEETSTRGGLGKPLQSTGPGKEPLLPGLRDPKIQGGLNRS